MDAPNKTYSSISSDQQVPGEITPPLFDKGFFALQWQFAERVMALSGLPLSQVLLRYTNFYIRLGLGRRFDPCHPGWQAFLAGLEAGQDRLDWTYQCYQAYNTSTGNAGGPEVLARFGCFAYALDQPDSLRIHFRPDPQASTSLGRVCLTQRRNELQALFAQVRQTLPAVRRVKGVSWLYNLEAYRRLFPEAYLASAQVVPARFHSMTLWGQFLNHAGGLNMRLALPFSERLSQLHSLQELANCFPFQVISVEAPVLAMMDKF